MKPIIVERRTSYRPPRRRSSLLRMIFYATSVLPAIWIAWQFNKLHQRLDQRAAAPQVIYASPPSPAPQPAPLTRRLTPPPQRELDPVPRAERVEGVDAQPPVPVQPPPRKAAPLPPAEVIDLSLAARRQRAPLAKAGAAAFIVRGLQGCEATHELSPAGGELTPAQDVTIRVNGRREILLRLSLSARDDALVLTIEPTVVTADDEEIPFYFANIQRIQARIRKEGTSAARQLESLVAERQRLQTWINAPVAKPLAARGQARARVAELNNLIPPLETAVQSLGQELKVAEAMEELAEHLDEDCQIELANPQRN